MVRTQLTLFNQKLKVPQAIFQDRYTLTILTERVLVENKV
ncbi:MAG: hypothetical protein K0Q74_1008 [Gammaproteobacteria bacterium]|nr:hypothetical protein [Gammaproteobacteria bacterium]